MIANGLESNICKIFLKIFPFAPIFRVQNTSRLKKYPQKNFFKTKLVTYQKLCHDPRNIVMMFLEVLHS